jgi:hypothetical protein
VLHFFEVYQQAPDLPVNFYGFREALIAPADHDAERAGDRRQRDPRPAPPGEAAGVATTPRCLVTSIRAPIAAPLIDAAACG